MPSWSFAITIASVNTDITAHVDVMSIVKSRRLHSEMKPNSNSVSFRCKFDSGLFQKLLGAETVYIAITKDSAAYFTGSLSPNYQAQIRDGAKYIDMIAEDWNIQKLGQTVTSLIVYSGFDVCKPSATATSIVHSLIAAAGCTAGTLDAIATTVPLFVVQIDDKATYSSLLTDILFQYGYVYFFDDDGTVDIALIANSGAVTTTTTFTDAAGSSNILGSLSMSKAPEKYDDIRVSYDKLEQKTAIVLFQDTSGATGSDQCQIQLEANGDANGKDYYPLTSGTAEVFSEWANPDGLKIWAATSAALASTVETGITVSRALTNYYKRCSFAYRNGVATPKLITKLTVTGDAYVIVSRNTARSTTGKKLLEIDAKYIYDDATAQALLQAVAQYYKCSDIGFALKSKTAAAVGSYALVVDSIYSSTSTKCRIIDRTERSASDGIYEYRLEAVADFASVAVTAEARNESAVTHTPAWYATNGYKMRRIFTRSATKPAQPTGTAPTGWQETPPLPATNSLWTSWIYVKATGDYINPVYPSATLYPSAGLFPSFPTTWSEVEYVSEADPQIAIDARVPVVAPRYLGSVAYSGLSATGGNLGDTIIFWDDVVAHCGIYECTTAHPTAATWTKQTTPSTRMISDAWPDIMTLANTAHPSAASDSAARVSAFVGSGVNFVDVLGANIAFINELFAQFITIGTGGTLSASSDKMRITDAGLESRTRAIADTPSTNDRKLVLDDDRIRIRRFLSGAWDAATEATVGMNEYGSSGIWNASGSLMVAGADGISYIGGPLKLDSSKGLAPNTTVHGSYDAGTTLAILQAIVPVGGKRIISGVIKGGVMIIVSYVERTATSSITVYGMLTSGTVTSETYTGTTNSVMSFAY